MTAGTSPRPPQGAPTWAIKLCQDIVQWVEAIRRGPQTMTVYTVATLPDATKNRGAMICVSNDATVGFTAAWSDGSNWKRPNAVGTVS